LKINLKKDNQLIRNTQWQLAKGKGQIGNRQRAKSKEQKAKSKEQRSKGNGQIRNSHFIRRSKAKEEFALRISSAEA
jgi:hypothetical protein